MFSELTSLPQKVKMKKEKVKFFEVIFLAVLLLGHCFLTFERKSGPGKSLASF